MSVVNAIPLLLGDEGYNISRSVRLRSSASAYFNRTPGTAGNRKTWTWNGWVKRGAFNSTFQGLFGDGTSNNSDGYDNFFFENDNTLRYLSSPNNAVNDALLISTQVFRDPSAWAMVTLSVDTTQATASNRVKIYYNGTQITSFSTATYPTQNTDLQINRTIEHKIGKDGRNSNGFYLDGYLTEVNFIDGQALTPSSFGETDAITGVWKPKKYAGTYGTNGFYLNFSDNSSNTATTIGKDNSGNGNNWTPNNISVTAGVTYDSMIDVPTLYADGGNGRGNYATLNPLLSNNTITFSDANLSAVIGGSAPAYRTAGCSIGISSGKYYFENVFTTVNRNDMSGVGDVAASKATWESDTTLSSSFWFVNAANGNKINNSSSTAYGSAFAAGDIAMCAVDMDNGRIWWGKNGTWFASGDPAAGTNPAYTNLSGRTVTPAFFGGSLTGASSQSINFGQRPFAFSPPTGFKALNTQNLPAPTILKGNQFFNATTYTGNGTTTGNTQVISNAVNGVSFQPDLVWIKSRSSGTQFHMWNDSVRGTNKLIYSNSTGAEDSLSNVFNSFNSDGFTVAYNSTYSQAVTNLNGSTYVAWQWKESVSAGFDIVTYTGNGTAGRQIAHNLGVKPAMFIIKGRNASTGASNWVMWHKSISQSDRADSANFELNGFTGAIYLNSTIAASTYGFDAQVNGSGGTYVAYLFSEVAGFSRFGSYTGNGSADGPFVFCGFRPRFVLVKQSDAVRGWNIEDTSRSTFNAMTAILAPQASAAEDVNAAWSVDALSNGFKIRTSDSGFNISGGTYIFAAFAESPFKNSLAR